MILVVFAEGHDLVLLLQIAVSYTSVATHQITHGFGFSPSVQDLVDGCLKVLPNILEEGIVEEKSLLSNGEK